MKTNKKPWWLWLIVILCIGVVGVSVYGALHYRQISSGLSLRGDDREQFPSVDESLLTP